MVEKNDQRSPVEFEAQLKTMIASNRRADAVRFFMKDMVGIPALFVFMIQLMPIWSKLKAAAHTLPYDAAVMGDFSLPALRAAAVKTPTLLSGGEKSSAILRHAVEELAKILPNNELKMLKGQSHNVSAKALAPVLVEFFAG
jgi:pimeloyl-ACP methyl ester carboxylesterase